MTTIAPPKVATPTRHRFNVDEYYALFDGGILAENKRIELLDGDIIRMPPVGDWHAANVDRFNETLVPLLLGRAKVRVQGPTRLDDHSEPIPDVMLLRWREDSYSSGHPGPSDVLLLIEVSDTSSAYDRNEKLPAYARAGISEVWIISRDDQRIEAYTEPSGGEYSNLRYAGPGQTISPSAFPDIVLEIDRVITG